MGYHLTDLDITEIVFNGSDFENQMYVCLPENNLLVWWLVWTCVGKGIICVIFVSQNTDFQCERFSLVSPKCVPVNFLFLLVKINAADGI